MKSVLQVKTSARQAAAAASHIRPKVNFDFAGYLFKRGSTIRNWKRRYMLLKGTDIFYFENDSDSCPPSGHMVIHGATATPSDAHNKPNCFEISSPQRTLVCYADNEEEMTGWIERITANSRAERELGDWEIDVDYTGYLLKRQTASLFSSQWKQRWFVLKGMTLYHFDSEILAQYSPSGSFNLDQCRIELLPFKARPKSLDTGDMDMGMGSQSGPSSSKGKGKGKGKGGASPAGSNGICPFVLYMYGGKKIELATLSEADREAWSMKLNDATARGERNHSDYYTDNSKTGWLQKRGQKNPGWKMRFFVLKGQQLHYFKRQPPVGERIPPVGTINLNGAHVEEIVDQGKDHTFMISTPGRNYFISAESDEVRYEWMSQCLIAVCR